MSAPVSARARELKAAFEAGRAAFAKGRPPTENPYRRTSVHPTDPAPDTGQAVLAMVWLRGWQKDRPGEAPS